jgi:hypothetical protein
LLEIEGKESPVDYRRHWWGLHEMSPPPPPPPIVYFAAARSHSLTKSRYLNLDQGFVAATATVAVAATEAV